MRAALGAAPTTEVTASAGSSRGSGVSGSSPQATPPKPAGGGKKRKDKTKKIALNLTAPWSSAAAGNFVAFAMSPKFLSDPVKVQQALAKVAAVERQCGRPDPVIGHLLHLWINMVLSRHRGDPSLYSFGAKVLHTVSNQVVTHKGTVAEQVGEQ
jgi:hypothetical protein